MLTFSDVGFAYGRRTVFGRLDLTVEPGKKVLLGPNGAGKSTLMKLACGLLKPRAGEVTVGGRRVSAKRSTGVVGYMPQDVPALRGLTVEEQATYFGWLAGLSGKRARVLAKECLERVALSGQASDKACSLSGGQLRRLGLACSLMGEPTTLLLDEPTAGLDPAQRARFRMILQSLDDDLLVLVSTHQVDDILELYDEIIVVDEGRVVWQGTAMAFAETVPDGGPRRVEQAYLAMLGIKAV